MEKENNIMETVKIIGSGGFSDVYLSRDSSGKEFAIKVLGNWFYEDPLYIPFKDDALFRFNQESLILSKLSHFGIPKFYSNLKFEN